MNCFNFQTGQENPDPYAQCRNFLETGVGPVGDSCDSTCTETAEMAALNTNASSDDKVVDDNTDDTTDGTTDDTTDNSSNESGDASQPTTPTVCTAENQGRCSCAQLEGLLDGVITYTWWDVTQEVFWIF